MTINELRKCLVEDHRVPAAVGIEHPDLARAAGQGRLDQRKHRCDTASAGERDHLPVGVPQDEPARRWRRVDLVAGADVVVQPIRHHAVPVPFHGDPQVSPPCAEMTTSSSSADAPRQPPSTRRVRNWPARYSKCCAHEVRHVEHQRHRIGGLADHVLDEKGRKAFGSWDCSIGGGRRVHLRCPPPSLCITISPPPCQVPSAPDYIKYLRYISSTRTARRARSRRRAQLNTCPGSRAGAPPARERAPLCIQSPQDAHGCTLRLRPLRSCPPRELGHLPPASVHPCASAGAP